MRIRLQAEHEPEFDLLCPVHAFPMALEDYDRSYGQAVYLCPVEGCREMRYTGPSDNDIYLRENPK